MDSTLFNEYELNYEHACNAILYNSVQVEYVIELDITLRFILIYK
jgi:hypothetical protein